MNNSPFLCFYYEAKGLKIYIFLEKAKYREK